MYQVEWCEKKDENWVVATLKKADGTTLDASINRTSKKGEVFPNFDEIKPGMSVEGELWQSTAGKWYLFPPRPQTPNGGANRGQGGAYKAKLINDAMDKKEKSISQFQATKEESIRLAGAQRDAVLVVTTFYQNLKDDLVLESSKEMLLKKAITEWRNWFYLDKDFNEPPPFL